MQVPNINPLHTLQPYTDTYSPTMKILSLSVTGIVYSSMLEDVTSETLLAFTTGIPCCSSFRCDVVLYTVSFTNIDCIQYIPQHFMYLYYFKLCYIMSTWKQTNSLTKQSYTYLHSSIMELKIRRSHFQHMCHPLTSHTVQIWCF